MIRLLIAVPFFLGIIWVIIKDRKDHPERPLYKMPIRSWAIITGLWGIATLINATEDWAWPMLFVAAALIVWCYRLAMKSGPAEPKDKDGKEPHRKS